MQAIRHSLFTAHHASPRRTACEFEANDAACLDMKQPQRIQERLAQEGHVENSRRRFLLRAAALGGVALAPRSRELGASGATQEPPRTSADDVLARKRNWGRWGSDDQKGAVNLIT